MDISSPALAPGRREHLFTLLAFSLCLAFNIWGVQVGWRNLNLPGHEFRQAQTALSSYSIQQDHNLSLDYPTPVLGKPWAVPLEFPLYQWSVVTVSDFTGLGLIKSGRVVSLTCFYLTLPAIFLLLQNLGVAPGRRWLVLALVLTSPLYIFYGRSFMIETMALMLSLWFWVAFERSIARCDWRWLILANLAGTGAGLVKATTLAVYAFPAAAWALHRLWRARQDDRWRQNLGWMAAAVTLPLTATFWWTHHAEVVRSHNPLAHFLVSQGLVDFTFGTWATRLSPELWLQKWQTATGSVTWWPVLAAAIVLSFLSVRSRVRQSWAATGYFAIPLVIFPVLYGFHDYYFMANGVLLLAALGLLLVGVAEATRWSWLPAVLMLALAGGQAVRFGQGYFETQRAVSPGGSGLTESLRNLVKPEEILVVVGQQWNPILPFYAQRRAMMIREEDESNQARLDAAFAALEGEKIGALLISSSVHVPGEFIRRAAAFGIGSEPVYRWDDVTVYLREDSRNDNVSKIQEKGFSGVTWLPGAEPHPERWAGLWYEVAKLPPVQRAWFTGMNPVPSRFFCSYGPAVVGGDAQYVFGAHPVTRLVFSLPAGIHRLSTSVWFPEDTFAMSHDHDRSTDGVSVTLNTLASNGVVRELYTRLVNPRDNVEDRRLCPIDITFTLEKAGEIELSFGPGPAGRDTHDSILMGRLKIL